MKICVLALQRAISVSSRPSLADSNSAAFPHWLLSVYFLGSGALGLGSQLRFCTPHISGESNWLLTYHASPAACGHLASHLKSLPYSNLNSQVVVNLILLPVGDYKAYLSLSSVVSSK